jgi:L-asparagine oxygenase
MKQETIKLNLFDEKNSKIESLMRIQLDNYSQEEAPYIVSEITKHIILKNNLIEDNNLKKIENFYQGKTNCLILDGCFPTQGLPPTPTNDRPPPINTWKIQASMLIALMSLTNHKVASYQGEMNGRLSHMVMPSNNNSYSHSRSTKPLLPHTEVIHGFFPEEIENLNNGASIIPHIFGLAALKNPNKASTNFWSIEDILNEIPYQILLDLMKPEYNAISQSSFDVKYKNNNMPVIYSSKAGLIIRFSYNKLVPTTSKAENALNILKEHLNNQKYMTSISLQPGQILLVNNRNTLHGRERLKTKALFDGHDRWLIRMYGFTYDAWRMLSRSRTTPHIAIN